MAPGKERDWLVTSQRPLRRQVSPLGSWQACPEPSLGAGLEGQRESAACLLGPTGPWSAAATGEKLRLEAHPPGIPGSGCRAVAASLHHELQGRENRGAHLS